MEIKQLRYFVKVAELNSVGKASDFLNIAQPTLSRTIRALEYELKTDLFSRDGRGVQFPLNPQASPNLVIEPVGAEVLYLIGAEPIGDNSEQVDLSNIGSVPLIMPHTMHTIRPLLEYEAARLGVMLNIAFEVDSVRSISELVQNGRGHTVMPVNSMRGPEGRGLHWQKIVKPEIEVTICLIQPARRPQTALSLEAAALAKATLLELLGLPAHQEKQNKQPNPSIKPAARRRQ